MKHKIIAAVSLVSLLGLGSISAAQSAPGGDCGSAKVEKVKVRRGGFVAVKFDTKTARWDISDLNATYAGWSPESCRGVLSLLTAAQLSKNKVRIKGEDGNGNSSFCATQYDYVSEIEIE